MSMSKTTAAITAVGGWVPQDLLTNDDLSKLVDTNDEWITSRTGIKKRHILKGEDMGTSEIGVGAVKNMVERYGVNVEEIDMVIFCTSTPDMLVPATANILAHKIGAKNAFGFDLNAACSGFLFGLTTASKFIESGTHKKVLVVGGDKMSSIIDYTDRTTCIIFGDGGGCVLLEPNQEGLGIIDSVLKSDGVGVDFLNIKAGGSFRTLTPENIHKREQFVYQDGQPVFKNAVKGMTDTLKTIMSRNNLTVDDVNWVIPHQANIRIIESVASMSNLPMEKVVVNIQKYGNTTNGTLPLCFSDFGDSFKKGDNILITAFGGGFTWGTILLKWAI
jgi:3-oxoacyl-[acyl-carrier-protein] synthase III